MSGQAFPAIVYLNVGHMVLGRTEKQKIIQDRLRLMGVADNESRGCIDCVGGAVDRAYREAARKVDRTGTDVAEVCRRVGTVVALPELDPEFNVSLVGIAGCT